MANFVSLVVLEKYLTKKQIFVNVLQVYVGMDTDVLMSLNVLMERNGTFILTLVNVPLELNGMEPIV